MQTIVSSLFKSCGFCSQEINDNLLFYNDTDRKFSAWLITFPKDISDILDNQAVMFESCKKACLNPAIDKNISMLVVWDTGGDIELPTLKDKIINIEENPYYFKKYVLYYSGQELQTFRKEMGTEDIKDFIDANVCLSDIFKAYQSDAKKQSWQALLYRIIIKLPFLNVNIDSTQEIDSLSNNINHELDKKKLSDFNKLVFNSISDIKILDDVEPSKLLDLLCSKKESE